MKQKIAYLCLFFTFLNVNAQDSISLPNVDVKIGLKYYSPFCVYVTNENKIIYKKDTISLYQIKERLYDFSIAEIYAKKQIHLFVDKNVRYSLIDSIKTEISSTNSSKYIVYRSNRIYTNRRRNVAKGIKHKSSLSYYSFLPPEYLRTRQEIKERDSLSKKKRELNPNLPPPPSSNDNRWVQASPNIERATYGIQQNIIDEALSNKVFSCYSISNTGLIDDAGKEINVSKEVLQEILKNNDAVFLKYESDLIYDNYIEFVKILQELKPNFKKNIHSYAEVIELSYQIQQLHKKAHIKLCN